jgi:hypothetical protein
MKKHALLIAVLGLSACSTMQYTPMTQQPNEPGVRVLYEYPQETKYKSLGIIDVNHYRPGFRAPTVSDVLPELKAKAASAGGNALIVRSHQVGQFDRSISITAEVLMVEWGDNKN